jgi:hypothetical protein
MMKDLDIKATEMFPKEIDLKVKPKAQFIPYHLVRQVLSEQLTDQLDMFTRNSVQLRLKNNINVQSLNENLRVCIKQDIGIYEDYLELLAHIQRDFRGVGQFLD